MTRKEVYVQFICEEDTAEKVGQFLSDVLFDAYGIDNISVKIEELTEFDGKRD